MTETPFQRLRSLVSYAFTKDDYNDPHRPPPPEELKEFTQNTMLLLGAGLVFGGVRQMILERQMPPPKVPSGYSKAEAAKLLGELSTRRLIRVLNSTLRGGLWCGWLGALYFGVEGLAEYSRNTRDPMNTVLGAWTSGAVFGLAIGGPGLMRRLQSCAVSVFLAGLAGYPIGYLQVQYKEQMYPRGKAEDAEAAKTATPPYPVRDYDVVGAVIGKLDASIKDPKKL